MVSESQPSQEPEGAAEPEGQHLEPEVEKPAEAQAPVEDSQPAQPASDEQREVPQGGEDQPQQAAPGDELKEPVVALEDGADKGEVPPTVIDDVHDVKSHVASNLIDENLPSVEEIKSRDVSAGSADIQPQIEETDTGLDAETVPVTTENTTADDTSNDNNDLMTSNDTTNTIPIQTSSETPVVKASGPEEEQPAPSEADRHGLEDEISGGNGQGDQISEAGIEPSTAEEPVEEAPRDAVPVSEDSSDIPAVAAGALAAGSLLAAASVVEASVPSQIDIHSSQDNEVRDISEGIPSEPSAHDLPPRSSSPTPDAATTVESSKSPSAGSQYGTVTSDQHEPQAVQSNELRERSTASGAESSAKSSKQDVVVKDEVVAKPSAASTTPGKLTILASMALGAYAVFKLANGAWGSRYP